MAFHKIGDSYYTDAEIQDRFGGAADLLVPTVVTAIGVLLLYQWIGHKAYFLVHTTTAKLIYVFSGLILFGLGYAYRGVIVMTVIMLFSFGMFAGMVALFWQWLMA